MPNSKDKIKSRRQLKALLLELKAQGRQVVFTNGCFDLLHPGHVRFLEKARREGDILVVALNSDASVRRIKGEMRPIFSERERCEIMSALGCVDFVTLFEEDTPGRIIEELLPDVLVKGGDWPIEEIVGRGTVEAAGGRVIRIGFEEGFSSSSIIDRIRLRIKVQSAGRD